MKVQPGIDPMGILSSFINKQGRIARVEKVKMEEEDYIDLEKHDDDTWE